MKLIRNIVEIMWIKWNRCVFFIKIISYKININVLRVFYDLDDCCMKLYCLKIVMNCK